MFFSADTTKCPIIIGIFCADMTELECLVCCPSPIQQCYQVLIYQWSGFVLIVFKSLRDNNRLTVDQICVAVVRVNLNVNWTTYHLSYLFRDVWCHSGRMHLWGFPILSMVSGQFRGLGQLKWSNLHDIYCSTCLYLGFRVVMTDQYMLV